MNKTDNNDDENVKLLNEEVATPGHSGVTKSATLSWKFSSVTNVNLLHNMKMFATTYTRNSQGMSKQEMYQIWMHNK